jgi:hypothetical protein
MKSTRSADSSFETNRIPIGEWGGEDDFPLIVAFDASKLADELVDFVECTIY